MPEAPLILVAEDDEDISTAIGEYLEGLEYRIAIARDRAEAERILRDDRPALLIADVVLEGGGGSGLAEIAREMGLPVLLISGDPTTIERFGGEPIHFLHKPFHLAELGCELAKLLPTDESSDSRGPRADVP
jgi:two-component system, OmpR family, response regulator